MIRDLNILNGDYSRVFKSTCEYLISKLSKRYNIDLSKYNIEIGTIRLDGHHSICGSDKFNHNNYSLGIDPLVCYRDVIVPNSGIANYKLESDFIKDLAAHEASHLFNHIIHPDKIYVSESGHDDDFKEIYLPLRSLFTKDNFVVESINGIEYTN